MMALSTSFMALKRAVIALTLGSLRCKTLGKIEKSFFAKRLFPIRWFNGRFCSKRAACSVF
jgi:hypothetical protein